MTSPTRIFVIYKKNACRKLKKHCRAGRPKIARMKKCQSMRSAWRTDVCVVRVCTTRKSKQKNVSRMMEGLRVWWYHRYQKVQRRGDGKPSGGFAVHVVPWGSLLFEEGENLVARVW